MQYLSIVRFRYPGKITMYQGRLISLFDDIVKNLDNLSITYDNKPISQNIHLFKGIIINTGDKDILRDCSLILKLRGDGKWIDTKITSRSPGLEVVLSSDDDKKIVILNVVSELFRRNEFVSIEGLIDTDLDGDNLIVIEHRIPDTDPVDIQPLPRSDLPFSSLLLVLSRTFGKNKRLLSKLFVSGLLLMMILATFTLVLSNTDLIIKQPAKIEFNFIENGQDRITAVGKIYRDDTITLEGIKISSSGNTERYLSSFPLNSVLQKQNLQLSAHKDNDRVSFVINIILIVGYIFLPFLLLLRIMRSKRKGEKILSLIHDHENNL